MPEGPEVRRSAAALHDALAGREIVAFSTRIKTARAWLDAHRPDGSADGEAGEGDLFVGKRIERVWSHGKWLVGDVEGGLYFASHFLMWGRWNVVAPDDEMALTRDKRERARIEVEDAVAILTTAPKFAVGTGDPGATNSQDGSASGAYGGPTAHLGPETLPYEGPDAFDADAFHDRLFSGEHNERTIGAALLDQTILAGVGNYLRAEILHACRMDPWTLVQDITPEALACLDREIPGICAYAYANGGRTIPPEAVERMRANPELHYGEAHDYNTKHWVFRRTNLECLVCGDTVRQKKQLTRRWTDTDGELQEKKRDIYFCPTCQNTTVELKPIRTKKKKQPKKTDA